MRQKSYTQQNVWMGCQKKFANIFFDSTGITGVVLRVAAQHRCRNDNPVRHAACLSRRPVNLINLFDRAKLKPICFSVVFGFARFSTLPSFAKQYPESHSCSVEEARVEGHIWRVALAEPRRHTIDLVRGRDYGVLVGGL